MNRLRTGVGIMFGTLVVAMFLAVTDISSVKWGLIVSGLLALFFVGMGLAIESN